jgi:predicted aspartyl protease
MFYAFETRYPLLTEYVLTEVAIFPYPTVEPEKHKIIRAKWDTGANHSVISIRLKEQLNLIPIASETISGVGGPQLIEVVRLAVKLPNDLFVSSKRIGVCNIQSAHDIDMLIGMDIIQLGDFHISNTDGKTRFSFVMPSLPKRYSLAEEADKLNKG